MKKLYYSLDQEIAKLQALAPIKCIAGCGACCQKADIKTTVLEFIPLAYHYLLQNKAAKTLEKLQTDSSPTCSLLKLVVL